MQMILWKDFHNYYASNAYLLADMEAMQRPTFMNQLDNLLKQIPAASRRAFF
jgi:hypothetical protein